ncbi:hypothetical protein DACRYDRAFT_23218 [Dacryopinax primogenitus]|uniref:Aminoglycoside phosphotransferase domain-containing protein n=1 Tax=Dacryopinax primogenitus (strain DJM 731) TaxID=1858805 RepID=M5FSA0_DACPD|nr:uncharacterized protein DACRYDRAFT_23218 [Dacryopinax primogenitus]EJU00256.1 hypothetical protein DACRYDRAFT_23218 [Dacryopinax primogenitus]
MVLRLSKMNGLATRRKLLCEAAVLQFLTANTALPIPIVRFHTTEQTFSSHNPLMLVSKCEGDRLDYVWGRMTLESKTSIIQQMAGFVCELFRVRRQTQIGTLHWWDQTRCHVIAPSGTLSRTPPAAFACADDLILFCLDCNANDTNVIGTEEVDKRDALATVQLIRSNPEVWKAELLENDIQMLVHLDSEPRNILVTETCEVTGLVDWEFSMFLPPGLAVQYPVNNFIASIRPSKLKPVLGTI